MLICKKNVRKRVLFFFLFIVTINLNAEEELFSKLKTGNNVYKVPIINNPGLHESYVDPVFNTVIKKITDPSQISKVS